jgi:hypothetical protein
MKRERQKMAYATIEELEVLARAIEGEAQALARPMLARCRRLRLLLCGRSEKPITGAGAALALAIGMAALIPSAGADAAESARAVRITVEQVAMGSNLVWTVNAAPSSGIAAVRLEEIGTNLVLTVRIKRLMEWEGIQARSLSRTNRLAMPPMPSLYAITNAPASSRTIEAAYIQPMLDGERETVVIGAQVPVNAPSAQETRSRVLRDFEQAQRYRALPRRGK